MKVFFHELLNAALKFHFLLSSRKLVNRKMSPVSDHNNISVASA